MPELPEVHTIITDLQKVLPGLKIMAVWTDTPSLVKHPASFTAFKKEIIGREIIDVSRKGKNILIELSGNRTTLVHQKMTGHLLYGKYEAQKTKSETKWIAKESGPLRDDPENRFIHLLFSLSNGYSLALCDMRKFAKVLIWPTDKLNEMPDINTLGPDPFDKKFTLKKFTEIIKKYSTKYPSTSLGVKKIKIFLMDQNLIAGIGNIYSDEILWRAGVNPLKPANKLSSTEIKNIYQTIKPVLAKAIKARGSSFIDYRDAYGAKGNYQNKMLAYQQTGKKCQKKDGGIIAKIKVGGRSGHYCPIHQKM